MSKCEQCGRDFLPPYPGAPFCSTSCRKEAKIAGRKPTNKRTTVDPSDRAARREGKERFKSDDLVCQGPDCTKRAAPHDHHVVYEQTVEKWGGDIWDKRNALALCFGKHEGQHKGKKLPITCLHDRNLDFAYELMGAAATDYLHRHYTGDDPRLEIWEKKLADGTLRHG
jgi:hypothetical protein